MTVMRKAVTNCLLADVQPITVDICDSIIFLTMACAVVITLLFCQEGHSPKLLIP